MSSKDVSVKKGTKRKSMASEPEGEKLKVVVEQPSSSTAGPVFGSCTLKIPTKGLERSWLIV
jgi:hypothetical protein